MIKKKYLKFLKIYIFLKGKFTIFDKNNKLKYLYKNLYYKVNYFNTFNILKFYIIKKLKIMIFK